MNNTSISTLTEKQKWSSHFKEMRNDYQKYRELYLMINTKKSGLIKFIPNIAQLMFEERLKEQARAGKPIRAFVLKGRQEGISTDTAGLIFHDTTSNEYRRSIVVSHEPDSTKVLFNMYKNYYENLPEIMRPMKRFDNKNTFTFENPSDGERLTVPGLKSSISVFTAKKRGGGRSQTIHNLHNSEVAFWEGNVKELMDGLLQAVPDNPWTMVINESTANGTSGYFHDGYQRAKRGDSDYLAIFIPWWVHMEYEMSVEGEIELDDYEKWLVEMMLKWRFKEHTISPWQALRKIVWRRWAIRNKCSGSEKTFFQEYPATSEEAFQKKEGRVYYAFDKEKHVIPHYEPDPDENIFIGGYDFGAEHPTAYTLFAIDKYGSIYLFREFKEVGTTFEEQAKAFKKMERHRETGHSFNISRRYRGHDSGAKQAEKELKRLGIKLKEGIVKRELGITTVNGLFLNNKLFISDQCVNTIFELENHVYKNEYTKPDEELDDGILRLEGDAHKDADVIKKDDDVTDSLRYGLTSFMHRKHVAEKPKLQKIKDKIKKEVRQERKRSGANW